MYTPYWALWDYALRDIVDRATSLTGMRWSSTRWPWSQCQYLLGRYYGPLPWVLRSQSRYKPIITPFQTTYRKRACIPQITLNGAKWEISWTTEGSRPGEYLFNSTFAGLSHTGDQARANIDTASQGSTAGCSGINN